MIGPPAPGQGAYLNWIRQLDPAGQGPDPQHTGVQIIDRTTVLELPELPTLANDFQARIDSANSRLNPLGLSPSAIAFDISPSELKGGNSHFDQVYERSLRAVNNAKGAFDQAARMTRLLRNQENQVGDYNTAIIEQELAFEDQLIEIYGTPYPGEVGTGTTYAQGYSGPDLFEWFIIDRPTDVVDTAAAGDLRSKCRPRRRSPTSCWTTSRTVTRPSSTRTITLQPDRYVQFSDRWAGGASLSLRAVTGTLQQALLDRQQAIVDLKAAAHALQEKYTAFGRQRELALVMFKAHADSVAKEKTSGDKIIAMREAQPPLNQWPSLSLAGENIRRSL